MIKRIAISLIVVLSVAFNLKAQELECNERIETNVTTPLVQVGDNKTISCGAGQPGATDISVMDIVTLAINFNHPDFIATSYDLTVDVLITPLSGTPFTIPLSIEYEPFDKQTFKDKDAYIFQNVDDYTFEIAGITLDGVAITDLPSNVYLDGTIRVNRIFDFTSNLGTPISVNQPNAIDLDCDPSATPDELEINWMTMTGALEYELEWAFINDYDATVTASSSTTTSIPASQLNYDFRLNSTRITTINTSYTIPLLFERGYLIYRVRGVGKTTTAPYKYLYGAWSEPTIGNVGALGTNSKYQTTSHDNLKNWQLTTNFAEEGKKKEVISYYDGSLRNRQSVTKINSDENIIVGETIYDHQGRAAVSVLPVPVLDDNCPTPTVAPVKFYPNFNQVSNGVGYSKLNFDVDVANCSTAVDPMFDGSGASLYYSPGNPKQQDQQQYVPDGEDHPFTVIDYTSDQTGRIRRQSGVGIDYKLGSGHETKYFYGKPDQIQLDRLFGSEVGFASHYKKNMVIDANNQISVSYLNQEGKVVATSLAGNPPTNVEPIPSQINASVNLEQEMILPTANNTTPAGYVNQMLFNETFLVTTAGPYTFDYNMASVSFTDTCLPNICFTCAYELTVKLTDDCGNVILDAQNNPLEFNEIIGNFTDNGNGTITFHTDCNVPTPNYQLQFIAQLGVGNYNIEKTLVLSQNAMNYYLEQYLDSNNNTCIKTLNDFEQEYLADIDSSDCDVTCETCAEALGDKNDFIANGLGTAAEYDQLLDECLAPCELLTMCETNYEMMLGDVSPNGQYGKYLDANNNINVGMYWLSVYNTTTTNKLQGNTITANWKHPQVFLNGVYQPIYVDDNDVESLIMVTQTGPSTYAPAVDPTYIGNIINNNGQLFIKPHYLADVNDFINVYWQDSWAKSLVKYHPEYCYYQQCLGHMEEDANGLSSQLFDAQLREFSFTEAVSAGYLVGNNTSGYTFNFNADPLISFTGAANYNATAANDVIAAFNNSFVIDGQMRNMTEVAAFIQKCGNSALNVAPSPADCFVFGKNAGGGLTTQQEDDLREQQWINLVALYLQKKNKIINAIYDNYAIVSCPGFNDCIGIGSGSFNPFDKGFASLPALFNPAYYNPQQPCSYWRRALYKYKQKRFLDESDMGADLNTINYQLYALTGQCPVAMTFQNLLNELGATGNLTATGFNLNSLGATNALLITIAGANPALPLPQLTYNATVVGNTLSFTTTSPTASSCTTTLSPVSGSINWADVIGFIGLDANSFSAPNYGFTVFAKVDDGNGGFTLQELTGTTCLNILNCNFNQVCAPNELAEDLQVLLSVLASDGQLTAASFSIGTNSNYNPYLTPAISAILTNTGNITWSYTAGPVGVLSDGVDEIRLDFNQTTTSAINLSQIAFFNNINVTTAGNNQFTFEAFDANALNLGTIEGSATLVQGGLSSNLDMGECENPSLIDCETPAHQNLEDLYNLLLTEMQNKPFAINDLQDILSSPAMTTGLEGYFGDANVPVTVSENIDCNVTPCLTRLTVTMGDCDMVMSFESTGGLSFEDLVFPMDNFMATGQLIQNEYYEFKFDATYTIPSGTTIFPIMGSTTCLPLNNCDTCFVYPSDTIGIPTDTIIVKDTSISIMPELQLAIDDLNARMGYTSSDPEYVTAPIHSNIMATGTGNYVANYIRFIENYDPALDNSAYLSDFNLFVADHGSDVSVEIEYARYVATVESYNDRATAQSRDTIIVEDTLTFATEKLATGCNTYVNHVDSCLQGDSTEAQSIIPFMENLGMIDTQQKTSDDALYKTYVEAYNYFRKVHPLAKFGEYLKLASFDQTVKNNLYFDEFAKAGFEAYIATYYDLTLLPDVLPFYDKDLRKFIKIEQERCVQQYFQLVNIINNYNNSAYASLNNHQLPIPSPAQGRLLCACLSDYMAYLGPYLEVPANQSLTLPLPIIRPSDCGEEQECPTFDCAAVDPCEQDFLTYQASVLEYNQLIADQNLTNPVLDQTVTPTAFIEQDLCDCVPRFVQTISDIRDTVSYGGTINFPSLSDTVVSDTVIIIPPELNIINYCADLPCGPDSISLDTIPNDSVEYIDPCIQNLINAALANAANAYQQYIDSLSQDFIVRYTERCTYYLSESFTKEYEDAEHHFTLYYYDQAGNLIKTIPPEGVEVVNTTSSSDPLSQSILADRQTNTKNFYTNHRMETKYIYNSLNQLTKQTLPDHDNMDICTLSGVNGLPADFHVEEAQFVTPSKGYLVGWLTAAVGGNPKDRGMLFTTNNGGANWTRVNDVVASNINGMQWSTANNAYAVGNKGVFLASKDAGLSWDMENLYTANVTENLNDLYIDASGNGLLVGENLTLVDWQGGVATKISLNTSPSFGANSNITAVDFDATNSTYYISVVDPAGDHYICYVNASNVSGTWNILTDTRIDQLNAISATSASEFTVAGNSGLQLRTTDNGANWIVTESGTRANIEHIYFRDANKGVAIIDGDLYKTLDGGSTWIVMDNSLVYNSLNLYDNDGTTASLMAACDNGTVTRIFINANGAGHEPKVADATVPVVDMNDAFAVDNGGNLIVVAASDDDLYVTNNFNASSPVWTKTAISFNIKQLRFEHSSGNHIMGLGINGSGGLVEFIINPAFGQLTNPLPILQILASTNPNAFDDIDILSNGAMLAYSSSSNAMVEFTANFGAGLPSPAFGTFTDNSVALSIASPTSTRLIAVAPNDNVALADVNGNIFELNASSYSTVATTTNNVRVEAINDLAVTQAGNISAVTDNGKLLQGSSTLLTLKVTPSLDDLNALDKLDFGTQVIMAGNNGSLLRWNGLSFVIDNSGTSNNLLAIDKQDNTSTVLITGAAGSIAYSNNFTTGTYTNVVSSESGNINAVKYYTNGKNILGADRSHVLFGINAIVVPTQQVFTDRLNGVHFNTINNGTVVGRNYTARSTTNGGSSFGVLLPSGGFTAVVPMELNDAFTGGQRFVIGEQNHLAKGSGNVLTTVAIPGASTDILYDISLNGNTGFVVGGDASNKAIAYTTSNAGASWTNMTIATPGTPTPNASINDATLYGLHHFTNNNTFIGVGADNTVVNFNNVTGTVTPTEITVTDLNTGLPTTVNLNDISFYDNKLGYVVGDEGHLFSAKNVIWNNGSDLEITSLEWDEKSITDNITTQPNDALKDVETISVASRFNAFVGGDYDASNSLKTYARILKDETNEISDKFWYDRLGRLVLSQNSKQFDYSPKRYSYTLYDDIGRIVEVGEKEENSANLSFNDIFGTNIGATFNPNVIDDAKLLAWVAETTGQRTEVTQTYYDEPVPGVPATLPTTFTPSLDDYRNRIVMVSYEDVFDNDPLTYNHATHYNYDIHGNVQSLLQDNADLLANSSTAPQRFKQMDYTYDLVSGNVNKVSYQTGEVDQWHHRYEYDADNRIQKVFVSDNDLIWSEEARYFYYDHGPLARVELGDNNVQGCDYAYTLQGWLKNMNSDELYAANDMGKDGDTQAGNPNALFARDAFGFSLHYQDNDYLPIGTFTAQTAPSSTITGSDVASNSNALYNGNIRAMVSSLKKPEVYTATTAANLPEVLPQATAYKYDQLNRLLEAAAFANVEQDPNASDFNQWQNAGTYDGRYFNQFTYDANGNIITQERSDEDGNVFDNMTYNYAKDGNGNTIANRLYHVNDPSASAHPNAPTPGKNHFDDDIEDMGTFNNNLAQINDGSNNYQYDQIGNLMADKQEEIAKIHWTVYGKVESVVRMAASIKKNLLFEYDANGNRIAKHQYGNDTPNSTNVNFDPLNPTDWEKSTYYSRDAQGNVMAIYEYTLNNNTQQNNYALTERNIYGSNRLGNNNKRVEMIAAPPVDPSKFTHFVGHRQYELSNHLGNVMSVISDRKIARDTDQDNTVDYYEPDVLLTFDYSPFGAPLHARSFTKEVCRDTAFMITIEDLNTDFNDGTTQGWTELGNTNLTVTANGELRAKKGGGGQVMGCTQSFMGTSGVTYDFSITIDKGSCNPSSSILLEVLDPNNTVIYTQTLSSGSATYATQFTASLTGAYTINVTRIGNASNCYFLVDDALVTHQEETTQIICEDYNSSGTGRYRWGFNGYEKDDAVSGTGNNYEFAGNGYSPRLGRRFNIDPAYVPQRSPYSFSQNSPLFFEDVDGETPRVSVIKNSRKSIRAQKRKNRIRRKQGQQERPIVRGTIVIENPVFVFSVDGNQNTAQNAVNIFTDPNRGVNAYIPGGSTQYYDASGGLWEVQIKPMTFRVVANRAAAQAAVASSGGAGTIVAVQTGPAATATNPGGGVSNAQLGGTNVNFWLGNQDPASGINNDGWVAAHEILHTFGFVDQYRSIIGPTGAIISQIEESNFDPNAPNNNAPDIMGTPGAGLLQSQVFKIGETTTKLSRGTQVTPVVVGDRANKVGVSSPPNLRPGKQRKRGGATSKPISKGRAKRRARKSRARF